MIMDLAKTKLLSLGFQKLKGNTWINGNRVVVVQRSKEFNKKSMRIRWREEWKEYYALIFDFSLVDRGVFIVPKEAFFNSDFVVQKRGEKAYENSGYWWSQIFPINH